LEDEKPKKRAARRAQMEKIRQRAWKKARERVAEAERERLFWRHPLQQYYKWLIRNDGHWIDGGCSKANCMLCRPIGMTKRDTQMNEVFNAERRDWLANLLWQEEPQ
jgi:hypothetical protein